MNNIGDIPPPERVKAVKNKLKGYLEPPIVSKVKDKKKKPKSKRKKRKRKLHLPDELIILKNPDKSFHEKWTSSRKKLNIPHPFRAVLLGPPNRGKTTVVKNLLLHQDPEFERLIVIHCNPEYTREYDDVGAEQVLKEIPPINFWDGKKKTMVVLDDLDFKNMHKVQAQRLNRLYGNLSTHNNISVVLCSQDPFQVRPIVRRCSNLWVLWKMLELNAATDIARRAGVTTEKMKQLFDEHIKKEHDSLWIDNTKHSPYPYRINGTTLIDN